MVHHVTWGKNTVSVFNTPATAAATTPLTGTGPTSLFGTPATPSPTLAPAAPASSAGAFSFSSAPVSTPQSPAPAFGIPAPAAATAAPSLLFPSNTGTPQQQQQQQQQQMSYSLGAPQQAALQAHMNATLHQESSRLESKLLQLNAAYSPYQPQPPQISGFGTPQQQQQQQQQTPNATCRFQHIFYDAMTPVQRMEQMSLGAGNYPPKPNHIPTDVWNQALSHNPEPNEYIPVLITSAEGLHSRLLAQQSKMKLLQSYLTQLEDVIQQRQDANISNTDVQLQKYRIDNVSLKRRLMKVMLKVDLCRGKNVPLQPAESELMVKLKDLFQNMNVLGKMLEQVKSEGEVYQRQLLRLEQERRPLGFGGSVGTGTGANYENEILDDGLKNDIHGNLNQHSDVIDILRNVMKTNERDLGIIKNYLSNKTIT